MEGEGENERGRERMGERAGVTKVVGLKRGKEKKISEKKSKQRRGRGNTYYSEQMTIA